jgi:hypothetical protein
MQKDYCQVLPSDEECPCPELQQKDCFQDVGYLGLGLPVLQAQLLRKELLDQQA